MGAFLRVVSAPTFSLFEKDRSGKAYMRLGLLFLRVGEFVFEQGVALGYALRDQPVLLGKLIGHPEEGAEDVNRLHEHIALRVAQLEGSEHDFSELFVSYHFDKLGIDLSAVPLSKELDEMVEWRDAYNVIVNSFLTGAGMGYHFPDRLREFWEYHYKPVDKSHPAFKRFLEAGLERSETPEEGRKLEVRGAELAASAVEWALEEASELLTSDEIDVLKSLAARVNEAK